MLRSCGTNSDSETENMWWLFVKKEKERNKIAIFACMKKWRRLIMMQKVAAFAFNPSNSFVESCLYFPLFSIHFVRCNPSFSVPVSRIKPWYGPIALLLGHICHVFSLSLFPNQLLGFKERERQRDRVTMVGVSKIWIRIYTWYVWFVMEGRLRM